MNEDTGNCLTGISQLKKPTRVEINKVANGFLVGGYGVEQKIANTIEEALALVRKELE